MYSRFIGIFANRATKAVLTNTAYTLGATAAASSTYSIGQSIHDTIEKEFTKTSNETQQPKHSYEDELFTEMMLSNKSY